MCGNDNASLHLWFDTDRSLSLKNFMLVLRAVDWCEGMRPKVIFLRVPREKSLEPGVLVDGFLLLTDFLICLQGNRRSIPEILQNIWLISITKTVF